MLYIFLMTSRIFRGKKGKKMSNLIGEDSIDAYNNARMRTFVIFVLSQM
jgi:hypothetical protein